METDPQAGSELQLNSQESPLNPDESAFPRDFPDRVHKKVLDHPRNFQDLAEHSFPDEAPSFDFDNMSTPAVERFTLVWRKFMTDIHRLIPLKPQAPQAPEVVNLPPATGKSKAQKPKKPKKLKKVKLTSLNQNDRFVIVENQMSPEQDTVFHAHSFLTTIQQAQHSAWLSIKTRPRPPLKFSRSDCIVFYWGHSPWNAPRNLREYFESEGQPPPTNASWAPVFFEVRLFSPEELLNSDKLLLVCLTVVLCEQEPSADRYREIVGQTLKSMERWRESDPQRWQLMVEFVMEWVLRRRPKSETEQLRTWAEETLKENQEALKEVRKMISALGPTLEEDAWMRGVGFGKKEGKREGKLEGKKETLLLALEFRFPDQVSLLQNRIAKIEDIDQLDCWIKAAKTNQTWPGFIQAAGLNAHEMNGS